MLHCYAKNVWYQSMQRDILHLYQLDPCGCAFELRTNLKIACLCKYWVGQRPKNSVPIKYKAYQNERAHYVGTNNNLKLARHSINSQ